MSPLSVRTACSRPPSIEARAPGAHNFGAERLGVTHQGGDVGAGIGACAAVLDQQAETVAAVERRLALAQFVLVQFQPSHAVLAADFPGVASASKSARVGKTKQHDRADQVADAGFLGELRCRSGQSATSGRRARAIRRTFSMVEPGRAGSATARARRGR